MRGIPQDKKCQFDEAVNSFRGEGGICINQTKLEVFLKEIEDIEIPVEEKLRQLAIALENESFEKGWIDLQAIYQAAARANPHDAYVFHSWGISAHQWFEDWRTPELADRLAIALEAEKVLTTALELEPKCNRIACQLGHVYYDHPLRDQDLRSYLLQAITWFRQALEWNTDNVTAQLYLAHCYHDLAYYYSDQKYWEQAIAAYENVNQARLANDWPEWRAVKCREQLAACYAWVGNEEKAVQLFSTFLDEIESLELDDFGMHDAVVNIDELVDAVTRKLDNAELLQRTRTQARRFGFEKRYEKLLSMSS